MKISSTERDLRTFESGEAELLSIDISGHGSDQKMNLQTAITRMEQRIGVERVASSYLKVIGNEAADLQMIQAASIQILNCSRPDASTVIPELVRAAQDPQSEIHQAATEALKRILGE